MMRLVPRTLFGQALATLLLGIGLALGAGGWISGSAREEAVRAVGARAVAERIVNLTRLIADAPREWRGRIVVGASDPAFGVSLSNARPELSSEGNEPVAAAAIAAFIRQSLNARDVIIAVRSDGAVYESPGTGMRGKGPFGPGIGPPAGRGPGGHMSEMGMRGGMPMHSAMPGVASSWRGLDAAIGLDDGQWLTFATRVPGSGPPISQRLLLALAVSTATVALLTAFAVRRMTAPLRLLSDAAERLGRDVASAPLPLAGTMEVQRAASAFNDMQVRLRRLIENRTLMLAAISHDLRSELTVLKLRAEAGEPGEDRERMLATIGKMEEMLTATLSFARDEAAREPAKRTDLSGLVTSIVDDMADVGVAVSFGHMAAQVIAEVKPTALRRALVNLIDNAVKYGGSARVSVAVDGGNLTISVDDDGPGIPEKQLTRVLQPFFRLEPSRNSETGGIGLGLAIVASVADAHGGKLNLANRPEGGLRATLELQAAAD